MLRGRRCARATTRARCALAQEQARSAARPHRLVGTRRRDRGGENADGRRWTFRLAPARWTPVTAPVSTPPALCPAAFAQLWWWRRSDSQKIRERAASTWGCEQDARAHCGRFFDCTTTNIITTRLAFARRTRSTVGSPPKRSTGAPQSSTPPSSLILNASRTAARFRLHSRPRSGSTSPNRHRDRRRRSVNSSTACLRLVDRFRCRPAVHAPASGAVGRRFESCRACQRYDEDDLDLGACPRGHRGHDCV
jgi:hypothetical protein